MKEQDKQFFIDKLDELLQSKLTRKQREIVIILKERTKAVKNKSGLVSIISELAKVAMLYEFLDE